VCVGTFDYGLHTGICTQGCTHRECHLLPDALVFVWKTLAKSASVVNVPPVATSKQHVRTILKLIIYLSIFSSLLCITTDRSVNVILPVRKSDIIDIGPE
jgi:hypothetical protein